MTRTKLPTRFEEKLEQFISKNGFTNPTHAEVDYRSDYHNVIIEWRFYNSFSKGNLNSLDLPEVIDILFYADSEVEGDIHTPVQVVRVFLKLDVAEIEKVDMNTQITTIRKWIKKIAPTVSVRRATGTAYGWIGVWGSGDCHDFTDQEREALKNAGLNPGGNYTNISPDTRHYWYVIAVDQLSILE